MDVLSPLFQLLFRALVVVLPLTVGWLAFRRLMLSRTANAWIYAITCLFAAVTAAGLLPWTMGVAEGNGVLFFFSALSPAIWMSVIMICDPIGGSSIYETRDAPQPQRAQDNVVPLILERPDWPDAPTPVFRHLGTVANTPHAPVKKSAEPKEGTRPGKTL